MDEEIKLHVQRTPTTTTRTLQPPLTIHSPIQPTRSMQNRIINHQIDVDKQDNKNKLQSCCGKTSDKRLLTFIASLTVSMTTLGFCTYQLAVVESLEEKQLYVGLCTLILGVYLPQPI